MHQNILFQHNATLFYHVSRFFTTTGGWVQGYLKAVGAIKSCRGMCSTYETFSTFSQAPRRGMLNYLTNLAPFLDDPRVQKLSVAQSA